MKSGNLKKILSITIISIVLALTITTIILAIVPKKLYDPLNNDFLTMTIWRDNVSNTYVKGDMGTDEHNKVINDILDLHEESLKDNVLSSIFQGTNKYNAEVKNYGENDVRDIAKVDNVMSIAFSYKDKQTLKIGGTVYIDTSSVQQTVNYTRAVIILNNSDSFEESTIYFCDDNFKSTHQIKFIAHQSEIWNYIKNLDMSQVKA